MASYILIFICTFLFIGILHADESTPIHESNGGEDYFVDIAVGTGETAVCTLYDDGGEFQEVKIYAIGPPDEAHTIDAALNQEKSVLPPQASTRLELTKRWLNSALSYLQNIRKKVSYTDHMQKEWDGLLHSTFSEGFLQFSGYYRDPAESSRTSIGEEMSENVRITLINGILNTKTDFEKTLKLFSNTHGDTVIHYVFRPTEGWSRDVCNAVLAKFGYVSPYAKLLAQKWKEVIVELGGTESGGIIIHYAHSVGTIDTNMARSLLSDEEQRMIHVISIGSPSMIPNEAGFASSINYVAKRDGICLLDPVGYVKGWLDGESNVEFLGSFLGIPFVDHMLSAESYDGLIKELGNQFSGKYSVTPIP